MSCLTNVDAFQSSFYHICALNLTTHLIKLPHSKKEQPMRHSASTLFLLLIIAFSVQAQKKRETTFFTQIDISQGDVLKTNDFVSGINKKGFPINDFSSADIKLGWQTNGSKQWHHDLNLPYYGLGIQSTKFSLEEEIGYPTAVYFFFGGPFVKQQKYSFDYEFGFGISYNWKPYNKIDNPFNIAIGSHHNAYIDLRMAYSRYLSPEMRFIAGIHVTHFSNGAVRFPNKGMNMIAPFVGLRYHFKAPQELAPTDIPKPLPSHEINLLYSTGKRSCDEIDDMNKYHFSLHNLSFEYLKVPSPIFRYGLGFDLSIDQHNFIEIDGNTVHKAPFRKQIVGGLTALGQFRANRLAIHAALGYELFGHEHNRLIKRLYQRLGLRVYTYKNMFLGVHIKAQNFSAADYIEWAIGFTI
ncbi:hypothetical protein EMN47_06910 [Prolixibacteraceae bacterium JC049]|nr:hypothetical protein [Prolixibacteraceae bacterium JC049]